jgi:hypothetical protein
MVPRKTFFKNRRDYLPSTPQKIAATPQRSSAGHAIHGLGRCRFSATTYATQTQRCIFRVSLRRDGRGQNVAATPESLKHIGVAPLRGFLEGGWKFFLGGISKTWVE